MLNKQEDQNSVNHFSQFNVFLLKFVSPQVKQGLIASITNLVYKVAHQLSYDLKLSILGYKDMKKNLKFTKQHTLVSGLPCRNRVLELAVKIYAKANIRVSFSCAVLLDFLTFCEDIFSRIV